MVRLQTQRAAFDATLDLFGDEPDLARHARLGPIGGGTDEITKEILGKALGVLPACRAYGEPMLVTLRPPEAVQVSFPDSPCELENLILQV
jgi:hypothetical protein